MKRKKLIFTWELLDKILKLNGSQIYNVKITDYGLLFDVYGREMEHVEASHNCAETFNTMNWEGQNEN